MLEVFLACFIKPLTPFLYEVVPLLSGLCIVVDWKLPLKGVRARDEKVQETFISRLDLPV